MESSPIVSPIVPMEVVEPLCFDSYTIDYNRCLTYHIVLKRLFDGLGVGEGDGDGAAQQVVSVVTSQLLASMSGERNSGSPNVDGRGGGTGAGALILPVTV